jgi:NitT/TauT family transport system ATP-binding protein
MATTTTTDTPILQLDHVSKSFAKPSGGALAVLADIDLTIKGGEILGLLGRSGSGKSTLLRIAAGLMRPSDGQALYRGQPLTEPADGIAVVFQTFALFPWLTVQQNVEAGLSAAKLPYDEVRRRSLAAIELIGLSGFQSTYPRELSGGMRQRVGFARAFVTQPTLLLMDEPFSALDVLTAETLRTDFVDLWIEGQLATKSVLLVTHNIEEAVMMCDRIVVLSSGPGRIAAELVLDLPQPRDRTDPAFHDIVDRIYAILTSRAIEQMREGQHAQEGRAEALPWASPTHMVGLVETLAAKPYEGRAELRVLAGPLNLQVDDLFPIAESLHRLEFAELTEGDIRLTAAGRVFAEVAPSERRKLFREHLLRFVPLAAHITRVLEDRERHQAPIDRFEAELEDHLDRNEAQRTLRTVIGWARYAELFSFDEPRRMLVQTPTAAA